MITFFLAKHKTWIRLLTFMVIMTFLWTQVAWANEEMDNNCLSARSLFKLFEAKGKTLRKALDTEERLFALREMILKGNLNQEALSKRDLGVANIEFIKEIKFSYKVQKVRGYKDVYLMTGNLYQDQYGNEQAILFYPKERVPWRLLRENYGVRTKEDEDYVKRGVWIASVRSNVSDGSNGHLIRRGAVIECLNTLYRYISHITPRFNVLSRSSTLELNLEAALEDARQRNDNLGEEWLRELSTNLPFDIWGVLVRNIDTGEIILLTGLSGAGKTTLKNALVKTGKWEGIADDQLAGYIVNVEGEFELYAGENPSTLLYCLRRNEANTDRISRSFHYVNKIYEIVNLEQIERFRDFDRSRGGKPRDTDYSSMAKFDLQGEFDVGILEVNTSSIIQDADRLARYITSKIDKVGTIIKGTEAKKEFDTNRAAGKYRLLEDTHPTLWREVQGVVTKAGVSLDGVSVYGIQSIVKTKNDFVHGYFDREKNELFLAVNIMEQARRYGKNTLEQYIRHELECTGGNHQTLRKQYKLEYAESGSFDPTKPGDEGRLRDIIREDTDMRVAANQYIETIKSIRNTTQGQKIILAFDIDIGNLANNPELLRQIGEIADIFGEIDFIADSGRTSLEQKINTQVEELQQRGLKDIKVIVVTNKRGKFKNYTVTLVEDAAVTNYVPVLEILRFTLTLHLEPAATDRLKELYQAITGQELAEADIERIKSGELTLILPPVTKISIEIYKGANEVLTAA